MDPISFIASITILVKTVTHILSYPDDIKTSTKERKDLQREITDLTPLLLKLRSRIESSWDVKDGWRDVSLAALREVDGPIDQLERTLEELDRKLVSSTKLGKFQRCLTWKIDKKACHEALRKIERLKSLIALLLQADTSLVIWAPPTEVFPTY